MFAVKTMRPSSGSTTPGIASPMATRSPGVTDFDLSSFSIVRSMAATACSGPPSRGVDARSWPTIFPVSSTSEAWIFVPPTSTAR